ncbi:RNA polymerase sigma factor [Sinanaerobacter chloroacetimidivorans]|uniref:Sigma-70 family RNA polymerase sigma factor n=1 Tax=Sinanaerobacter chloroacetimidivorans TaxID=2818044 RepID=A0A8J8B116_9FIRM|nr:sigma-70 family RNA polymerase sigma factor [Sinanaerobacter chloroacetimidivorans]MBR0597191.1 sigma-70 family RNA polymerase sigma factor [Sinanaerobacter chloroacetimidivorans]
MLDIDAIYKDYAKIVFKFLISLCNDVNTAEELTQETFYRAIKSAKRYDGTCKVSTWLCQIAKHVWYQEIDHRKRKETSSLDDKIAADELNLEEKLCRAEEKMHLIKAVHILDETAKEVVLLRITGAFSFKEIGEVFNKNENWARVTFYRAKQKIMKGRLE